MFRYSISFGHVGRIAFILMAAAAILTPHPLLTLAGIIFPFLLAKLLWRRSEPPILFVAFLLQWLQVTIKIFYADFYNLSLDDAYVFPDHIIEAYYLSLLGLLVQSISISLVLARVPCVDKKTYSQLAQH